MTYDYHLMTQQVSWNESAELDDDTLRLLNAWVSEMMNGSDYIYGWTA